MLKLQSSKNRFTSEQVFKDLDVSHRRWFVDEGFGAVLADSRLSGWTCPALRFRTDIHVLQDESSFLFSPFVIQRPSEAHWLLVKCLDNYQMDFQVALTSIVPAG